MSQEEIPHVPYVHVNKNVTRIVSCVDHIKIYCTDEMIKFYPADRKLVREKSWDEDGSTKVVLYLENKSMHEQLLSQEVTLPSDDAVKYLDVEGVKRIGLHKDFIELDRGIRSDFIRKSDNSIFSRFEKIDVTL